MDDSPVLVGELVPTLPDATKRELAVPGGELRDGLALGWIESYDNDSPHTAERYARDVPGWRWKDGVVIPTDDRAAGSFFAWADSRGFDVFAMLPWHVEQYVRHLKTGEHVGRYKGMRKLADSTIAGKVAAVSSFYSYCARQSRHVAIPNPTIGTKRPKVAATSETVGLSKSDVDAMLAVAARRGPREYALVMVLATTGLRVSELCQLDTGDLVRDTGEWMLSVVRKGYSSAVLVPVPPPAARALRRYMRGRRGPLFLRRDGERMTRQAAAYTLTSVARAALDAPGEANGRGSRITPHSMRHTATTLALKAGVPISDVQVLMGHASITTTARYDRALRVHNNPASVALGELFDDGLPDVD